MVVQSCRSSSWARGWRVTRRWPSRSRAALPPPPWRAAWRRNRWSPAPLAGTHTHYTTREERNAEPKGQNVHAPPPGSSGTASAARTCWLSVMLLMPNSPPLLSNEICCSLSSLTPAHGLATPLGIAHAQTGGATQTASHDAPRCLHACLSDVTRVGTPGGTAGWARGLLHPLRRRLLVGNAAPFSHRRYAVARGSAGPRPRQVRAPRLPRLCSHPTTQSSACSAFLPAPS